MLNRATVVLAMTLISMAAENSTASAGRGPATRPIGSKSVQELKTDPPGPEWNAWREAIDRHFRHAQIRYSVAKLPYLTPVGHQNCPAGPFRAPGLRVVVRSPEKKVFGDIELAIFEMKESGDGYGYLKKALGTRAENPENAFGQSCAFVGNTTVSFVQTGHYWVEVFGHCSDGALYRYEVGDVLRMLRVKEGGAASATFAMSECGHGKPEFQAVEAFLAALEKKTSIWGKPFPATRNAARLKWSNGPEAEGARRVPDAGLPK